MPESLVFSRVHLPRPISTDMLTALVNRLTASDVPRPLAFEIHATADGLSWLFGAAGAAVQRVQRLLAAAVPGVAFEAAKRRDVAAVSRIVAHPAALPLREADPEEVGAAIFHALAARRDDEHIALQVILGRTRSAHMVSSTASDPLQSLGSRLLGGTRAARACC